MTYDEIRNATRRFEAARIAYYKSTESYKGSMGNAEDTEVEWAAADDACRAARIEYAAALHTLTAACNDASKGPTAKGTP